MATGENSNTWGTKTNTNLTLIEEAISGKASVAMADANQTLTTNNGASDQARCMVVECTGALTANRDVVCPTVTKAYIVNNLTTGGYSIVFKTSGGTGVTVAPGSVVTVYCDGTNVVGETYAVLGTAQVQSLNVSHFGSLTTAQVATLTGTEELTNKTLNASVAKGTWTASGTWTIPAVTLGGTADGNNQLISNVGKLLVDSSTSSNYVTGFQIGDYVNTSYAVAASLTGIKGSLAGIPTGMFEISDSTAVAAGVGGAIGFAGKYTGGTTTCFAAIAGEKTNATDGNYGGDVVLYARDHGGSLVQKLRASGATLSTGSTITSLAFDAGNPSLNIGTGALTAGNGSFSGTMGIGAAAGSRTLLLSSADPFFWVTDTNAAANQGKWYQRALDSVYNFTAINDAENSETTWLQATRSGATITAVTSNADTGGHVYQKINSTAITDVSSTGFAVTGTITATGTLTAGAITSSGLISTTYDASGAVFKRSGASTNRQELEITNTSGRIDVGVASSGGGGMYSNLTAYDAFIAFTGGLSIGDYGGAERTRFTSTGLAVTGTITATSTINKVTITAPATGSTLTIADGATLATSGAYSTTLTATAATNVTLPTTGTLSTLSGTETLTNKTFLSVKDTVYTITDGAAFEIDPANGSVQTITLGASRTPAATNFAAGQSVLLGIDDGTAYSITWTTVNPTWVKTGGSAGAPTLATTGYTWLLFWKVGTTIYASEVGSP